MTLKSDAKFKEKLASCLENDMSNFANFHQSTWKCQNWNLDKMFLSRVENVWASNLAWSCVSQQWRETQKFKRNWLVVLKLTWTSQIFTRALEKSKKVFCFNWLLVFCFNWLHQSIYYFSWHWGVMQILKKDWPVVWKKTWKIWQIFTRALESVEIRTLMVFRSKFRKNSFFNNTTSI